MEVEINQCKLSYRDKLVACISEILVIYICIIAIFMIKKLLPSEYIKTAIFYIVIVISASFLAKFAQLSKNKLLFNIFFSLSFSVLFFIVGFRKFSGIDDVTYIKIFNDVQQMGWFNKFISSGLEPGYLALNMIVGVFTKDYLYMQLVSSFIPIFLFYRCFYKNKNKLNLAMSVFLFSTTIYFQMLSASLVRMFIAIGIIINVYPCINIKNYKKFYIGVLTAGIFHYSSLFILILSYFIINEYNIKRNKLKFIFLCIIIMPIVFILISVVAPLVGARYSGYGNIGNLKVTLGAFDTIPILILLLFYRNKNNINRNLYYLNIYIVIFSLSSIISVYSSIIPIGRLIYYCALGLIMGASIISKNLRGSFSGIIFNGVIFCYGFIYLFWTQLMLEGYFTNLYPYQNIFFNI